MIEAVVIFAAMSCGMFLGLFVSGSRRRVGGVDGHVRIGNTWHDVDQHGRVIFRVEADQCPR